MPLTLPADAVIREIHDSVTSVTARLDIYESDGTTLWMPNAPLIDGNVSIDSNRDERRTLSLILDNISGALKSDPNAFWYDKVLRPYRGIRYVDGAGVTQTWEAALGRFFVDTIRETSFPHTTEITARDGTKKLLKAKFPTSVEFAINQPIEEVIRAIAINGGIATGDISFPLTGKSTTRAFFYDRTTERWKAMKEIAEAYNYDLYFRADGVLTMTPYQDPANPAVSPAEYTFEPGAGTNRIPNGGFETPLTGNPARAAGWQYNFHGFSDGQSRPTASPFKGDYSMAITNAAGQGSGTAAQSMAVVAGEEWRLVMRARSSPVVASGMYFRAMFFNADNGQWGSPQVITWSDVVTDGPFTGEWTEYSGVVTVPAGATFMRVVVYAWSNGTAYTAFFDEVEAFRIAPIDTNQGNLADFTRNTADARLYNHVVVTGESTNSLPVTAEAENTNPDSPTRIARIGRRTFFYTSPFITTVAQAQEVADRFLSIHALEQYEVDIQAIVVPYIDTGIIVNFIDPEPSTSGPVRYLFTNAEIPLKLGKMSGNAKRVTVVG